MGLQSATLLNGNTNAATGGSAITLGPDGQTVANGIHLIDASVTDYRVRPQVTAKVKMPTLDNLGAYSKARKTLTITIPKILASTKTVFPLIRIELEDHPEMSQAEVDKLKNWACQTLMDTDFTSFWATGSIA